MKLKGVRVGIAMTGSFCTMKSALDEVARLKDEGADIVPIMSETLYKTDTRFGKAEDFIERLSKIAGTDVLHTIKDVEPIGPGGLLDILAVIPCTGNTLSKMALGVTDSSVTMAANAV